MNSLLAFLRARLADERSTDRELLDRFAAGRDPTAFAEIVRRHGPLVWGVCRRSLADPADAEDAFQAAFLVLVRRVDRLPPGAPLGPWLYRVAVWSCRNLARGNRRRAGRVRAVRAHAPPAAADTPIDDLCAAIDAALLSLPERHRAAVILCHLQGRTRREAAERLGCREGTLSSMLNRALAKLRVRLAAHDPAAALAVAASLAAPPAIADAAVAAAVTYVTATGVVPTAVLATANGVIRMFVVQKCKAAAVALAAAAAVVVTGYELAARQPVPLAQAQPPAAVTRLAAGRWVLTEFMAPHAPLRLAEFDITEKDGRLVAAAVDGDEYHVKDLRVDGRRVTLTFAPAKADYRQRFDGLFDPADPRRILGCVWSGSGGVDRAVLEFSSAVSAKPALPVEWSRYLELAIAQGQANPATDAAAAKAAADAYEKAVPDLFRKLVADRPGDSFGHAAALELFGMLDKLKPAAGELNAWAEVARRFAATHGPQFEAGTVGEIASRLTRVDAYAADARTYAAEADRLAKAAGMPAGYADTVALYDAERAAWASQPNPPSEGATWTATLGGRVTDAQNKVVSGATVRINNMQWVTWLYKDDSHEAVTDADGRYVLTVKCKGSYRAHVTGIWASKSGFVRVVNSDRHKLLPGQSAAVDFRLSPGLPFGGSLKLRPRSDDAPGERHSLAVIGSGVSEYASIENGKSFEVTVPAGTYTVETTRGGKKLTWPNLAAGRTDYTFDEPAFRFTPETVGTAFDELWKTIDRHYSYLQLKPDVDWQRLRDEYRSRAAAAKSADELAAVLADMLGKLKDGHVWIEKPGGERVATYRPAPWAYNGNRKVVRDQLTDVTECGPYAVVGRTKPDGFGYFLMTRQSAATPELVAKAVTAIGRLSDAPGFVVDLRTANGGSEPLAQEVARLFNAKEVVYAKSKYREGRRHDQFTQDYTRLLPAAKGGKPFTKPVVCLIGPGCVSSGEGFAKMMAALPHVTTVGLPTRGSSGNPGPAEVGDTGLTVYFSRWVDMLPDGTPIEGKGVPPKLVLDRPAADYADADPTLTRALEVLRAAVRQ